MNRFLRIGFFSALLAQNLYSVNANWWWELDEDNNPIPPAGPILRDPLTIYEDSTLNVIANGDGNLGNQFFSGNIIFNHNLVINLLTQRSGTNETTTIYRRDNHFNIANFDGIGTLTLNIDSPNVFAKSIFNFDGGQDGLNLNVKTNIRATEGSQIFSVFRVGGSTLNITNDFIVDLSKATGVFSNANPAGGITNAKTIFDAAGTINVNAANSTAVLIQMNGDIANFGGITTINLANGNSFFKGRVEAVSTSATNFNLSNASLAEIQLTAHNRNNNDVPNFTLNLNSGSIAKIDTKINSAASRLNYNINNASLYADFTYDNAQNPNTPGGVNNPAQALLNITNSGTWYVGKDNAVENLMIGNPSENLTKDNFENLTNLASVDFRFANKGTTLRAIERMNEDNRFTLNIGSIGSPVGLSGGVFRLYGILNANGWNAVNDINTGDLIENIATDQVHTSQLNGTHHIQLFWDKNSFDKSLLNTDLEPRKIIVAKEFATPRNSNFVGAVTPIGVYNYITNLKKENFTYTDNNGALQTGSQWIVTDVQRADNSYMSRLLDSLFQTQFRIYKTQIDTLNLRMGELRKLNRVHGVWLRSKYGRLGSKETNQTLASWDEFASVWLGYDQNFYVLGGKNFLGLSFDVNFFNSNGIPDQDDFTNPSYIGQSQSYGLSIYDTFFFDNGFYIDALAKYYLTKNKFIINSEVLSRNTPKFFSHNFYASFEVGKRFKLPVKLSTSAKDYLYLKPDAGMSFAFSSGQDWSFMDWSNQRVNARLDFNSPVNMRTGLTFGWTWNSRGYEGDLYAGTSFEYDFNSGGDLRLEDFLDRVTLAHRGNFNWRINAGTNVILNEYWRLYFDVDTAFFGIINSTFTLNAGVRINFGRLHPQMPYIPPYMDELEDLNKYPAYRRTIPQVQNYETEGILDNYRGNKKYTIPPKIIIKQKPFEGTQKSQDKQIEQLKIEPKVEQKPQGAPEFIDNPGQINAPSQNYKRDTNMPMYNNLNIEQRSRSMDNIKETYNRGYR
ncbi:autotransporter outer membrane beta-barrel domain-containing protein [Helicobacter cholecystus]|uniref:Autotransporter outer membrane beta-barrel domain-containing protein n=1 Tax=Helicobacter cholecystus TaxID=45498 RepID=A0A3D8IWC5_9HELI|nr:autotransporter outer membrane beta-barrel domain-containing protein [Helicobacter cholecystus]RDU69280.1 autotransporter outer membrane beta-barrel domain-containing protein [Helicobacter cholecystus]VEJ24358.1 major ring-forming surface antigen protein Hsr [Helicobacter cholecystus]